jgi:hypothetical protein
LSYRETVAMAEKGLVRMERPRGGDKDTLAWGVAIAAVGLALTIGMYGAGFGFENSARYPLHFGPWMLVGLIPTFFGLGLVLIYVLTREDHPADTDRDNPHRPA